MVRSVYENCAIEELFWKRPLFVNGEHGGLGQAHQIKKASSLLESFPLAKDIQNCLAPILLEADRTTFTFVIEIALVNVVAGECASDEFEFLN
jgi:hypothetical protein